MRQDSEDPEACTLPKKIGDTWRPVSPPVGQRYANRRNNQNLTTHLYYFLFYYLLSGLQLATQRRPCDCCHGWISNFGFGRFGSEWDGHSDWKAISGR